MFLDVKKFKINKKRINKEKLLINNKNLNKFIKKY